SIWTGPMLPTGVTRPKVGELTTVSIAVKFGVLKTFDAVARNSNACISLIGMFLFSDMSKLIVPGPMIVLRPASPNCPRGGAMNAVDLDHSAMLASAIAMTGH